MSKNKKYKLLLKSYGLTEAKVGEMFGYKSPQSWSSTTARPRIENAIVALIDHVEADLKKRMFN